jgi:redox-sensitive bicupin YhaK (pirin superfamily)
MSEAEAQPTVPKRIDRRKFLKIGSVAAGTAALWPLGVRARPTASLDEETGMSVRQIKRVVEAKPTVEGAGVHLRRAFGFGDTSEFDPFLLLDDFRNDDPADYRAGFPWHPHRGIETITYVLAGTVNHSDSLGNSGVLGAGDVQWMTAGSGILHQEMPQGDSGGRMHGFQLWANLPSALKMTAPRYQDIPSAEIPEVTDDDGTRVRVVCGTFWGKRGPVDGIAAAPQYLDVWVPPGRRRTLPVERTRHAFAYVFEGSASFRDASAPRAGSPEPAHRDEASLAGATGNRSLVLFDRGDEIVVQAGSQGIRFLLVSGEPIKEPIAWRGPIVMNTREELQRAFMELQNGTFIKHS